MQKTNIPRRFSSQCNLSPSSSFALLQVSSFYLPLSLALTSPPSDPVHRAVGVDAGGRNANAGYIVATTLDTVGPNHRAKRLNNDAPARGTTLAKVITQSFNSIGIRKSSKVFLGHSQPKLSRPSKYRSHRIYYSAAISIYFLAQGMLNDKPHHLTMYAMNKLVSDKSRAASFPSMNVRWGLLQNTWSTRRAFCAIVLTVSGLCIPQQAISARPDSGLQSSDGRCDRCKRNHEKETQTLHKGVWRL